MTGEVGDALTRTAQRAAYAFGDDQCLTSADGSVHVIDHERAFASENDDKDIDLRVDMRGDALARAEYDEIDVQIRALL